MKTLLINHLDCLNLLRRNFQAQCHESKCWSYFLSCPSDWVGLNEPLLGWWTCTYVKIDDPLVNPGTLAKFEISLQVSQSSPHAEIIAVMKNNKVKSYMNSESNTLLRIYWNQQRGGLKELIKTRENHITAVQLSIFHIESLTHHFLIGRVYQALIVPGLHFYWKVTNNSYHISCYYSYRVVDSSSHWDNSNSSIRAVSNSITNSFSWVLVQITHEHSLALYYKKLYWRATCLANVLSHSPIPGTLLTFSLSLRVIKRLFNF